MNNTLLIGLAAAAILVIGGIALVASEGDEIEVQEPQVTGALTGTVVEAPIDATSSPTFVPGGVNGLSAPSAATRSATQITSSTATLHGSVDPKGSVTTYWFEYSSDPKMGAILMRATPQISLEGNAVQSLVEAQAIGLSPRTTYYYRIAANNSSGTTRGTAMSFTTK